jgi:hypothetical protein
VENYFKFITALVSSQLYPGMNAMDLEPHVLSLILTLSSCVNLSMLFIFAINIKLPKSMHAINPLGLN